MKILLLSNDIRLEDEQSISLFNIVLKTSEEIQWVNLGHYYNDNHPEYGNIIEYNLEALNGKGSLLIYPFNLQSDKSSVLFREVIEQESPNLILIANNDLTEYDFIFSEIDILNSTPVLVYNHWVSNPIVYGFKPYYEVADKILCMNETAVNNAKKVLNKRDISKIKYLPTNIDTSIFNGYVENNDLELVLKNNKYRVIAENHPLNIETFIHFIQQVPYNIRRSIALVLLDSNEQTKNYINYNLSDKLNVVHITKSLSDKDLNFLFSISNLYFDNKPLNLLSYNTLRAMSCGINVITNKTGSNTDYIVNNDNLVNTKRQYLNSMFKNQYVYSSFTNTMEDFSIKMFNIYNTDKVNKIKNNNRNHILSNFDSNVISKEFVKIANETVEQFTKKFVNLPIKINNSFKGILVNNNKYI